MPEATVRRFRFLPPGSPVAKPYRSFRQPRPMMAVEETVSPSEPILGNELRIVPKLPDGPSIAVKSGSAKAEWQPGQACVTAPGELREQIVASLVEFAWYESELRRLEAVLAEGLPEAERDLEFAFQIRPTDHIHRDRVTDRMKFYTKLRLEFAQLQYFLTTACGELSPVARRWYAKWMEKADAEARAEAFDAQLELREELYEGAADRFTDAKGWAVGHRLEVIIVVLLVLEFAVMATDLIIHLRDLTE